MTDIGKPGQYRRVKLLKQQPITDDVLDIVRHHGEHGGDEEEAEIAVMQSREGRLFCRTRGAVTLKGRSVGSQCCGPQGRSLVLDRESNGS